MRYRTHRRIAVVTLLLTIGATACGSTTASPEDDECSPGSPNLAQGRAASASGFLPDRPPSLAVDGDPDTAWSAGEPPVQWLEIDLGTSLTVTCIRLLVSQSERGTTSHRINGGAHTNPGAQRGTLTSETENGQWLQLEGEWTFQFLRVTTETGPSSVSWSEVVVR